MSTFVEYTYLTYPIKIRKYLYVTFMSCDRSQVLVINLVIILTNYQIFNVSN